MTTFVMARFHAWLGFDNRNYTQMKLSVLKIFRNSVSNLNITVYLIYYYEGRGYTGRSNTHRARLGFGENFKCSCECVIIIIHTICSSLLMWFGTVDFFNAIKDYMESNILGGGHIGRQFGFKNCPMMMRGHHPDSDSTWLQLLESTINSLGVFLQGYLVGCRTISPGDIFTNIKQLRIGSG